MNTYSIIVPVFKSNESLFVLSEQISNMQVQLACTFELILVNDSPWYTETCNALAEIEKIYPFVKVVTLWKNQGQQIALLTGLLFATGKYCITMDDDLQHPVTEIPKLIRSMDEHPQVDAIFACPPYKHKKHSPWRNLASLTMNKIDTFFLKKPKGLKKSAFRIMRKELAIKLTNNYNAMPSVSSLIIFHTHRLMNVEVDHSPRQFGKSNYTLRKMISLALNDLIHYSSLPLKVLGVVGFAGFLFSIIFILITLIRKLFF
ncbi:MAG TPA: glycosyltransferase, partial [Prolixibacteraceae bacterium]|nr:glycosyltransferase [Prolixibacteraceae bacterium]